MPPSPFNRLSALRVLLALSACSFSAIVAAAPTTEAGEANLTGASCFSRYQHFSLCWASVRTLYAVPVRRSAYFGSNFPIEEEARYLGSTTPSRMPGLAAHGQTRPQPCASHLVNSANS